MAYRDNSWSRFEGLTTLNDFSYPPQPVDWDEAEEWDDAIMPMRPVLRAVGYEWEGDGYPENWIIGRLSMSVPAEHDQPCDRCGHAAGRHGITGCRVNVSMHNASPRHGYRKCPCNLMDPMITLPFDKAQYLKVET